jgi:hypothetical protein
MSQKNKSKRKILGELLYAANNAEMLHKIQVSVHDPFPYIKTTRGEEFILLDAREFEIVKKDLEKRKSKIKLEKYEDYVDLAKVRSLKDEKFSKLSLDEKVLVLFLE